MLTLVISLEESSLGYDTCWTPKMDPHLDPQLRMAKMHCG